MVAWWTRDNERHAIVALSECIDSRQPCTGSPACSRPRVDHGIGVGVELTTACLAEGGQLIEIGGVVYPRHLCQVGHVWYHDLNVGAQVQVVDAFHHGRNPSRPFGVATPVVLGPSGRATHDQHRGVSAWCRAGCWTRAWRAVSATR